MVIDRTKELAVGNQALIKEVSERKRTEEELRVSEAKFRALSENAPAAIFIYQGNKICYANPEMEVISGYSRQELLEMNFWDTVHPDFRDAVREQGLARLRGEPLPTRYEFKIVTKRGQERWVDFTDGIFELDGKPAVIGMSWDITERKRTEEALRKSEEYFRRVTKQSPIPIAIIGDKDEVDFLNERFNATFGYTLDDLPNLKAWWQRAYPDEEYRKEVISTWQKALKAAEAEGGDIKPHEYRVTCKDGSVRFVEILGSKIGNKILVLLPDITERKLMEQALRTTTEQLRALAVKLESAREEEGRRIGRELHDEIGSAMTGLKWDLEGLHKLCSGESGQIDCSLLRERIEGMVELIDTTCSAVQKISSELRPAILDDLGLIPAIESQAEQFAARTGIVCQFDSLVESIDLDREKATAVFRIVQEALTNILRHSRANRVNIIIEKEDGELIVEIKDNGRGITEEEKARPSSLGLIGMQERAHLIKGRIEITGFPGKGTVVTVRVPISNQNSG
jgi:PAS domain S-box-containing protein